MQLLKKFAWFIVLFLLFSGFLYGGLYVRNILTAKNYSEYWQQQAIDVGDYIYVVIGDSTALGVGSSDPKKSYVGLLRDRVQETTGRLVKLVNLASPDADIKKALSEQLPKLKLYKPDLVTVSVGQKDIDSGRDPSAIATDYSLLLEELPNKVSYIAELQASYDSKKNIRIQNVNTQLKASSEETGVNVIPLYEVTKKSIDSFSYYDWDFYHPNDKGHAMWADAFWYLIE